MNEMDSDDKDCFLRDNSSIPCGIPTQIFQDGNIFKMELGHVREKELILEYFWRGIIYIEMMISSYQIKLQFLYQYGRFPKITSNRV